MTAIPEQAKAQAVSEQYAKRLKLLRQIDQAILAQKAPAFIAQLAIDHLQTLVAYQSASVLLFNMANQEISVLAAYGQQPGGIITGQCLPFTQVFNHSATLNQQTLTALINQAIGSNNQQAPFVALQAEGVERSFSVPISIQTEIVGLLNFGLNKTLSFDDNANEIAREIAAQLAIAIHQTRLAEAEQAAKQVTETINTASLAFNALLDLDMVLQSVLLYLETLVPYDSSNVMLLDNNTELTVSGLRGYQNWHEFSSQLPFTFDIEEFAQLKKIVVHKEAYLINDVRDQTDWDHWPLEPNVRSWLGIPLRSKNQVIGIIAIEKMIPHFFTADHISLANAIANQATSAIVNARLYEQSLYQAAELEVHVQERTQELERLYNRQSALAEIALTISQPSELQALLDHIVTVIRNTLPASAASVVLWQSAAQNFQMSASTIHRQDQDFTAKRVRRNGGATRWMVDHQKPVVVTDIKKDPFTANPMLKEYDLNAYAGVPLVSDNEVVGVIYALDRNPRHYEPDEIEFLDAIATRVVVAIDKVNLYQRAKTIAAEEERQRLSRDLHDAVSQSLFSSSLIAESTLRICQKNPKKAYQNLEMIHRLNRGALAEMRMLLLELRPDSFAETDLNSLLQKLLESVVGRSKLEAYCHIDPNPTLNLEVKTAFYRITQESLNNIVKHAQAQRVSVVLHQMAANQNMDATNPEQLLLEIRDDGCGFDLTQNLAAQHGLKIMRERAEIINAHFEIISDVGQGTTIRVTWPATSAVNEVNNER